MRSRNCLSAEGFTLSQVLGVIVIALLLLFGVGMLLPQGSKIRGLPSE